MSIAYKLNTIAENEQKIYDKGYNDSLTDFVYGNVTSFTIYSPFVRGYSFYYSNFVKLSLPNTGTFGHRVCYHCESLTEAYVPQLRDLQNGCFAYCYALTRLHLPKAETIATDVFAGNQKLTAIIIDTPNCVLQQSNAFLGSAVAKGNGYIYVPDDAVNTYKTATNWATYANQIKGQSELPEHIKEWLNNGN